jgi:hypothetical protein
MPGKDLRIIQLASAYKQLLDREPNILSQPKPPTQWCVHEDESITSLPDIYVGTLRFWVTMCNHCSHITLSLNGEETDLCKSCTLVEECPVQGDDVVYMPVTNSIIQCTGFKPRPQDLNTK